ncbi:MAG: antibiotic biosynthesis monooxygenase [Proteobacteria bacterium]|nr:antibiotic biosynthesis monooxygenase [Pseudomonadota bacterium]MBU1740506.1 antibiotic biosynthesis monooxygenase [Pseudomonadota bacterium]
MSSTTVRVIALFQAKKGKEEELKELLAGLTGPTRAEAGCIRYELIQQNDDPASLAMVEEWQSPETLGAHSKSEHLAQARGAMADLLAAPPDIRLYTLVA